jgi:hypothetical protein
MERSELESQYSLAQICKNCGRPDAQSMEPSLRLVLGVDKRVRSLVGYLYSAANVSASLFISSASAAWENKITR